MRFIALNGNNCRIAQFSFCRVSKIEIEKITLNDNCCAKRQLLQYMTSVPDCLKHCCSELDPIQTMF